MIVLLSSGMVSLAGGYYYLRQGQHLESLFKSLEKDPIYDFNHINEIGDLPTHKDIFLGGVLTEYNQQEGVLFLEEVSMKDKDDDMMWLTNQRMQVEVANHKEQKIRIEGGEELWMYNLTDIKGRDLSSSQVFRKGMLAGQYYVFQGRMEANHTFKAKFVLSENKELFLNHLDFKIGRRFQLSKAFSGLGAGCLLVHALVRTMDNRRKRKEQNQKEFHALP